MSEHSSILIVDDNPKNLQVITKILSEKGYSVAVANSGLGAIEYIDKKVPDLFLLDIMMPEMNGYELCQRLKEDIRTKDIPVIFLTAKNEVEDIVRGFELGGVDYIIKPFNSKEVISRIRTHIDLKKSKEIILEQKKELEELNKSLEQKVLERTRELLVAKEKAEESNRMKSIFMANMSHELRTPLVAIIGASQILEREAASPMHKNWSSMIYKSGKRLLDTLNMILDISTIESSKVEINYDKILLTEFVNECVELFTPLAVEKGLRITTNYLNPNLYIVTDDRLLRDSLHNIINNAIKFTNSGEIRIEVGLSEKDIYIKVSDTGIGIPSEKIEYIFKEFAQASEGVSRRFEGNGLGLSIAKKYMDLLKGNILVNSELGKGSDFTITLPIRYLLHESPVIEKKPTPPQVVYPPKTEKRSILVVEDDEYTKQIFYKLLNEDYFLQIESNPELAIDNALERSVPFDILLIDLNLGADKSGFDVCVSLKKNEKYKRTPIVAITAFATEKDIIEIMDYGFTHLISKPFDSFDLLTKLKNI